MSLSVIIVTRNRAIILAKCLERIISQLERGDEIIVVDNASTDGTAGVVVRFSGLFPIRYLTTLIPGASHARNWGLLHATKDAVAFLDDDSFVLPGWRREIVRTLLLFKRRKKAIFQGRVFQRYVHRSAYERIRSHDFQYVLRRSGVGGASPLTQLRTLVVCNIFSYRKTFRLLRGPFNEELFPFRGEDDDLAIRAIGQGIRLLYIPSVKIIHYKIRVYMTEAIRRAAMYGRAHALYDRLYFSDEHLLLSYASLRPKTNGAWLPEGLPNVSWREFFQVWWYRIITRAAYHMSRAVIRRFPSIAYYVRM